MAQTQTKAKSRVSTLEGHELADDYVRTHLPGSRWSDTWDLLKSNFVSFVIINVFTLLFFVPGIVVVYFRGAYVSQMGATYPFSFNPLFTYPLTPSTVGTAERITLSADLLYCSLLVLAGMIASIGLAGANYSVKKLINTHGTFTLKGYFHGIKVCYFNVAIPVMIFMTFIFGCFTVSDWSALTITLGGNAAGAITAKVFIIIATVLVGIIAMWIIAVGVSYRVKLRYLLKNSFVLLFGTILQTLFMIGFSLMPVWLLMIGLSSTAFMVIGGIVFIFIGFSFIVLCWLAYTQWVFDSFITPAIAKQEEARKSKLTPQQLAEEEAEDQKAVAREILAAGRSELVGRPIRPIEGGTEVEEIGVAFGRADIARVAGDRAKIQGEITEYYVQHKGDAKYVEYERLFAEREKALKSEDKKGKKKKVNQSNLLGRK